MKFFNAIYILLICITMISFTTAQQFAVLLDPGHRNNPNDCGAPSSCGGYCEADLVVDTVKLIWYWILHRKHGGILVLQIPIGSHSKPELVRKVFPYKTGLIWLII